MEKRKKGQAALEFLMTYGWAILAVLIAIGALAYFSVLNPMMFVPERCALETSSGLFCEDYDIVAEHRDVRFKIRNSLGEPIKIWTAGDDFEPLQSWITIHTISGDYPCHASSGNQDLSDGEVSAPIIFDCNDVPDGDLVAGKKFKANLEIFYQIKRIKANRTARGELVGTAR